jgi:hypothetical protein
MVSKTSNYLLFLFLFIIMSGKKKAVDPYAGQYPPPPPLAKHNLSHQQQPFYIIDPRRSFHEEGSSHSIPDNHKGHYHESSSIHNTAVTDDVGYYDPDAVDLREYLYAERQQKLRVQQQEKESQEHKQEQEYQQQQEHQQQQEYQKQHEYQKQQEYQQQQENQQKLEYQQQPVIDMEDPYRPHHGRPEPMYYSDNNYPYQNEELMYPSPMMIQPMFNHQQSSALFSPPPHNFIPPFPLMQNHSSNPSMVRPPNKHRQGCCCFGISFCACICTIILALFFLAGIGLIVATKIIGDKCTDNTGICGQVLHDGFLYGGIVLAGTSALIIIWRIIRWYGYTRSEQTNFTNTHN